MSETPVTSRARGSRSRTAVAVLTVILVTGAGIVLYIVVGSALWLWAENPGIRP